jgi:hypothetical protein
MMWKDILPHHHITMWYHNPEDHCMNLHCYENLTQQTSSEIDVMGDAAVHCIYKQFQ